MRSKLFFHFFVAIFIVLIFFGCSTSAPEISPVSPTVQTTSSPTVEVLPSPNPTATNTPMPLGVLLAPPEVDTDLARDMQALTSSWAEENGLRFQVRETLSENDFQVNEVQWVVALPPFNNLASLVSSAPTTKFLAVGFSDLEETVNLSVVSPATENLDQQGFLAGYIAAIITPDWRVGVISLAEDASGKAAREGFFAGARYFCGLCRPQYPPFFDYPLFVELPSDASASQWQSAADILLLKGVETIYIVSGAGDEALLLYLVEADVNLLGGNVEMPKEIADHWIASLHFDLDQAIQEYWPSFIAATAGERIQVPLTITNPNPELLSPGRQRIVEDMLEEILSGYIETQ